MDGREDGNYTPLVEDVRVYKEVGTSYEEEGGYSCVGIKMNSDMFWIIQLTEQVKLLTGFNPAWDGSVQHGLGGISGYQGHRRRLHGGVRPDTISLQLMKQEDTRVKYLHYTTDLPY